MQKIILYILLGIFIVIILLLLLVVLIHLKLFGKRFVPDPLIINFKPEDLNIKTTPYSIKTKNGTLHGYIYNKDHFTKKPFIIFAHGMWSTIESYTQDICYYANKGYEVLAVNHFGVDTSDGKSIKGLGNSIKSLDLTINFVKMDEQFKDRDIYLVGHSWGANAVLGVLKFHPEIKKVVAISPFITNGRLLSTTIPPVAKFLIPFFLLIEKIKFGKYGNISAIKTTKNFSGDIYILHSIDDKMVNYELNTKYLQSVNNKILYTIEKTKGHNPNYSQTACDLMNEFNIKCKALSGDEQKKFKQNTDFSKLGELDISIMDKIVEFLDK